MPTFFFVAISIVCCFLLTRLPGLTFFIAILWGVSLIGSALYLDKKRLILLYSINLVVLYVLAGVSSFFFYLSFFGLAGIVMGLLVLENKGYYEVQKWGIIASVIGVSVFIFIAYFGAADLGMEQLEQQAQSYIGESIQDLEAKGMFEIYAKRGITKADFEEKMYSFAAVILKHIPAFYYLQSILVTFTMLLFASWVSLKRDFGRLKKRPFSQEVMPWQLVWVMIAGLLLWLIGRSEMSLIYYAGSNMIAILVPITMYFGLAALIFKLREQKTSRAKWIIIPLIVLGIIFPISVIIFLSIFGLFDALLDYRKLRINE
ncbi:MAG TPA: DUF2232 domain-containing protein [Syntrophomonadaceae bacterium]|nr:DUF2232 domain-containing protein [Syntrophomonadaceae bacterium]